MTYILKCRKQVTVEYKPKCRLSENAIIFDSVEHVLTFGFMNVCNVTDYQDINFIAAMGVII